MNLKTLWYFLWAVSSGGVSSGARQLGIAQSTLSGAIGALEAELGVRLFEPTSVGPRPTQAALRLRDYSLWLVAEAEQAFVDLRSGSIGPLEPVQVSAHGIPRCSSADWAVIRGLVGSVARNGPRGVYASSEIREHDAGDAVSIRYRALPENEAGTPSDGTIQVRDRWVAIGTRGAIDLERPLDWASTVTGRAMAAELSPGTGSIDMASVSQVESSVLDPAGVHYALADRREAVLLVPSTMLPAGIRRAPGLHLAEVTNAPLLPVIEISVGGAPWVGKRHLARSLAEQMRMAIDRSDVPPPQLKALEAHVDLHTLRCFAATMETGNTARAAQACFIVQPALSGQIRKLETALSRQLFHRSNTGMAATPAGRRLHALVEPILADHATALERLRDGRWSGRRRGRVRLGLIPAANEDSLIAEGAAEALAAWRSEFPDTPISVAEGYTSVLLRWLRTHLIDVAIIDTTENQPGLDLMPIFRESVTLVFAPGSHWDTTDGPIEGSALAAGQLAIPSKRFGLRTLFDKAFSSAGVGMEPGLEVDSMAIALRLVRSGQWATILPPSAVHRHLREGTLRQRPLTRPSIDRRICAATRSKSHLAPEMTSLLGKIDATFRARASNPEIVLSNAGDDFLREGASV